MLHELAGNLATLNACRQMGSPNEMGVVYSAYSSLLVPLFSDRLPERVAWYLGKAYGRLMLVDRVYDTSKWDEFMMSETDYLEARRALMAYAKDTFRLKF